MKVTPEKIKSAREDAGLTQEQAAEMVFVTRLSWSNWERGVHPMPRAIFEYFIIITRGVMK